MKKKTLSFILAAMVMISGLTACGSNTGIVNTGNEPTSVVESYAKKQQEQDKKNANNENESIIDKFVNGLTSESTYIESKDVSTVCTETACEPSIVISPDPFDTEEYAVLDEHGFHRVSLSPLSTFSADVDTASYSNVRRFIDYGYSLGEIPKGAVRTEEMVNYFKYNYNLPENGEPFGVTTEIGDCPWNADSKLLNIGIRTEKVDFSKAGNSNIVFLIDVSGSMFSDNKLPLLVKSFKLMLEGLGEKDRVSIVTYAGEDKTLLSGVPGSEKEAIEAALDSLEANGCTNGGQGIISAYRLAEKYYIDGGNNRVILATDGDLNVGITSASDLEELIAEESKTGIYLTVLGFGTGNYSDERMETLADRGNGNYAYIDSIDEARKVLCEELGATMVTVAKDVKFQVEFNPAVVAEYRLIGYEDRTLEAEDFDNDAKDAGEIGAGHCVTALYEIITVDGYEGTGSKLKYQDTSLTKEAVETDEWLTVSIRYKEPSEDTSKLLTYPVGNESYREHNSDDFLFAATVAEFAQILRGEEYVGDSTLLTVAGRLGSMKLTDSYKASFSEMVNVLISNSNCVSDGLRTDW